MSVEEIIIRTSIIDQQSEDQQKQNLEDQKQDLSLKIIRLFDEISEHSNRILNIAMIASSMKDKIPALYYHISESKAAADLHFYTIAQNYALSALKLTKKISESSKAASKLAITPNKHNKPEIVLTNLQINHLESSYPAIEFQYHCYRNITEILAEQFHNLNNILASIQCNLELGISECFDSDELTAALDIVPMLCRSIQNIQDISSNHTIAYAAKPIVAADILQKSIEAYSGIFKKYGISVFFDDDTKNSTFLGDSNLMMDVLLNIYSNMRRALTQTSNPQIQLTSRLFHSPETQLIGIEKELKNPTAAEMQDMNPNLTITIAIENNGPKIPYEDPEKAFERRNSSSGSSGLGLSSCRNIISKFNGKIYALHPNKEGAVFFIELPVYISG